MSKKKAKAGGKAPKKVIASDGRVFTSTQLQALDKAERLRALKGPGATRRRAKAAAIVRGVEAQREYAREVTEVAAGIAETFEIAEARGEKVVEERVVRAEFARGEHGELVCEKDRPVLLTQVVVHKRIRDRDGLLALVREKKLTEREHQTGLSIRYLVERVPGRLGSCLEERTSSGATSTSDPFVAAALQRAYLGVVLTAVERAFGNREDGVAELRALRAIAGEGSSLRSLGEGQNAREANLRRLKRALAVAEQAIATIRQTGGLRIRAG